MLEGLVERARRRKRGERVHGWLIAPGRPMLERPRAAPRVHSRVSLTALDRGVPSSTHSDRFDRPRP